MITVSDFAVSLFFFSDHWEVASCTQLGKLTIKSLISSFKNVNFRVEKLRVVLNVQPSVNLTKCSVHFRTSLLAELAMEDKGCSFGHDICDHLFVFEESVFHLIGVVEVDGTIDVTAFILILESTIDNDVMSVTFACE